MNLKCLGGNIDFHPQVYEQASTDLFNMGISVSLSSPNVASKKNQKIFFFAFCDFFYPTSPQIISYTLREIKDEESYMESMGQSRTSEVQRDARIGEAECNRRGTFWLNYLRRQK